MDRSRDQIFAEWMKAHLPVLHRISRAFAGPADQHDLLQELMLAVWKAAPAFRGDSSPATFVYRVAHNRALTWHRRTVGWRLRARDAEGEAVRRVMEAADDGDEGALLERLYAAIRRLKAVDRSIVLLSLEGLSYLEIGAIHGLSETNVGARLSRVRARLSTLVEEPDDGL